MTHEQRIATEKKIARRLVQTLLAAGHVISINNGDDEDEIEQSDNETAILAAMAAADEDYVICHKVGKRSGWIHLVYGNDGWDLIADYTTNIEAELEPVNEYAESLDK